MNKSSHASNSNSNDQFTMSDWCRFLPQSSHLISSHHPSHFPSCFDLFQHAPLEAPPVIKLWPPLSTCFPWKSMFPRDRVRCSGPLPPAPAKSLSKTAQNRAQYTDYTGRNRNRINLTRPLMQSGNCTLAKPTSAVIIRTPCNLNAVASRYQLSPAKMPRIETQIDSCQ